MSAAGPPSYYVWYRVAGDACEARAAVTAMMLDVAVDCGVVGRLMNRADDPKTWMEVYENVHDDARFEAILSAGAGELAFEEVLQHGSSRRVECFEDFNPCA